MLTRYFHSIFFSFFLTSFIFCFGQTYASDRITLEDILKDTALLKEIALKIKSQNGVLIPIVAKLNSLHSPQAKQVWSEINLNMIGQSKTYNYPQLKLTYKFLEHEDNSDLRAFFGKTPSTFYSTSEIANIDQTIVTAINSGTYSENTGGQSNAREKTFLLTYNVNLGEKCTKDRAATTKETFNVQCEPTDKIIIIFYAKDFFDFITSSNSKESWKNQNLVGSIDAIYSEK